MNYFIKQKKSLGISIKIILNTILINFINNLRKISLK